VKKEVLVGFDHFFQVFLIDRFFPGGILLLEPLLQHFRRGLQINHKIGRGQLRAKVIVVAIVGVEFLVGQVEAGEEFVFLEDEISDHHLLRARAKVKPLELLKAADQKRELRLESGPALALIKRPQKGVVFEFRDPLGVEAFSQNPRQRALSDAYGTFHCNVAGKLEKLGHGVLKDRCFAWQHNASTGSLQLRKRLTPLFAGETQYNRRNMLGVLASAAGLTVATAAGYQSLSPTGQWCGRTFTGLPPGSSKKLALTYDDGPNDPHTPHLLEALAKYNVHATFFLIGRYVKQRPDIAREIAQAGHAIGNHTFSHPNLIFASAQQTRAELQKCEQTLYDAVGQHSQLFRPPFGGRRPITLRLARSLSQEPVMWSVTGWDWSGKPAAYVEQKVCKQIRGGDVILLHDGSHVEFGTDRSQTVLATDRLIERYKAEGYNFVTIPEMMGKADPRG